MFEANADAMAQEAASFGGFERTVTFVIRDERYATREGRQAALRAAGHALDAAIDQTDGMWPGL